MRIIGENLLVKVCFFFTLTVIASATKFVSFACLVYGYFVAKAFALIRLLQRVLIQLSKVYSFNLG